MYPVYRGYRGVGRVNLVGQEHGAVRRVCDACPFNMLCIQFTGAGRVSLVDMPVEASNMVPFGFFSAV